MKSRVLSRPGVNSVLASRGLNCCLLKQGTDGEAEAEALSGCSRGPHPPAVNTLGDHWKDEDYSHGVDGRGWG
jgi:hypothetical protein